MKRRSAVAVVMAASLGTAGAASLAWPSPASSTAEDPRNRPLGDQHVGRVGTNAALTPVNAYVTPAGRVVPLQSGRLVDSAISPDGHLAVATAWHQFHGYVVLFDLTTGAVRQEVRPGVGSGDVSFRGVLWAPDGTSVWVAQSADLLHFPVQDGRLGDPTVLPLPTGGDAFPTGKGPQKALPADLAWAPDGSSLLATLNGLNTLGVIDPASGAVRQIPVGNAPRDVAVVGSRAYVADQGGRPAGPADYTNNSYGTPIVATAQSGRAATGTVSEVDLSAGRTVRTFPVGLQPTALLARGTDLLVANSDSDTVTAIDTATDTVGVTINVNPAPGAPHGASPNALAFLDSNHLAVSLGRDNAVAVYSYGGPRRPASFQGLIPTAWYPGALAWDAALGKLVVTNLKGYGAVGPPSTIAQGPGTSPGQSTVAGHNTYDETGSLSLVAVPSPARMAAYTRQVFADNQWNGLAARNAAGSRSTAPVAVPVHLGEPSRIKHVFLIVKENRTYDQVLGDDRRGDGAPALAQFGRTVTPNSHALAARGPLIENFYGGGTLSADGHNWLTQAFVNDYVEREFGNFVRSYPAQGGDPLAYAPSGFLWENAVRHGRSARSWGEYAHFWTGPGGAPAGGDWRAWYHDAQVLEGRTEGPLNFRIGSYSSSSDIPSLDRILARPYPRFELNIPDQYRADLFLRDLAGYETTGTLPALNLMWVMCDHTSGTDPGLPTPVSQVADNDLATGRIVDAISHSRYWKDTAVFVIEDDTQNGVDHRDGHRNMALVASPYAKPGVVSTYYSQLNLIRTIEQILGLPPMNQLDLAAQPMFEAFTDTPNDAPYDALPNQVPLDRMNPSPASLHGLARQWAQWAAKQNFRTEDMVNMAQLNRDVFYSSTGFAAPYPGDRRVLAPEEVPGAGTLTADADG